MPSLKAGKTNAACVIPRAFPGGGPALLCLASLLAAGAAGAVSGTSDIFHLELVGESRACGGCERAFELRATRPDERSYALRVPARGAAAVAAIHVSRGAALIVLRFARPFAYRVQAYTLQLGLSWSGRKDFELIASELSVSPDGRHVLYRPGHAPGVALDRRLFLWDLHGHMPGPPLALHHLDCHPDAPCPPVLGTRVHPPPAPDDADAADPPVYPLHAVWDLEEEPPSERVGPEWSWRRKRVAFLALDRLGWLNLVVVPLDDGPGTACRIPVVPYRGERGSEEVRSLRYENHRAVVEMFGNRGVATVHRIPVPLWCRAEEERRGEPAG